MVKGNSQQQSTEPNDEHRGPYGDVFAIIEKPPTPDTDGRHDSDFIQIGVAWEGRNGGYNITIESWPLAWRQGMPTKLSFFVRQRKARS